MNPFFHSLFLAWVIVGGVLLLAFDKRQLFAVVNTHYTVYGDVVMYYTTWLGQPEVIAPTLLLLMISLPSLRTKWFFFTAIVCNVIPLFIQQLLKRIFHHPRPLNYFDWAGHKADWIHYLPTWPELLRNSFPSGHSQGAFSFFCLLTFLLPKKYKHIGIVFFFAALSVCYSRLYLAAHFFADIYTGSIIGGVSTTLIYSVMLWLKHNKQLPIE